MPKKILYAVYTVNTEQLLGTYDSIPDFVERFFKIPRNDVRFSKKCHSVENTILQKQRTNNPRKWIIFKEEI